MRSSEKILEIEKRFKELLKGVKRKADSNNAPILASDLQAQLQRDPEYQKWSKEMEKVSEELKGALLEEAKDILDECRVAGKAITSVYDLVNGKDSYPSIVPILVKYMDSDYHQRTLEGIVRALTVKEARGIGLPAKLLDLYDKVPMEPEYEGFRWAISNTLWFTVTKKDKDILPRLQKIMSDPNDTTEKNRFIGALKKLGG